jgi:hypothetical protein
MSGSLKYNTLGCCLVCSLYTVFVLKTMNTFFFVFILYCIIKLPASYWYSVNGADVGGWPAALCLCAHLPASC